MKDIKKKDWLENFKFSPMWHSLNEKQQLAVSLPNKNSLILAGAGTGKTKTLVARIAALIVDGKVPSKKILSLTFTNKAAKEMRERIESSIDNFEEIKELTVGTFHSVALEIIQKDLTGFGYKKNASIISEFEQKALIDRMFRDKGWTKDSITIKRFAEMMKSKQNSDKKVRLDIMSDFLGLINRYKEKGVRAKDMAPQKWQHFEIFRTMYATYEEYLIKENSMDFAELLLLIKERMKKDKTFFEKYSGSWEMILVDEFQDTNPLQYEILELFTQKSGAIFAVGDDDQSIYGFRGARVQNIFDFEKECDPDQVVKLEQNYRCSRNILSVANDIIRESNKRMGKELWTDSENGDLVFVKKMKDNRAEAEFIAEHIERKYKLGGVLPEDIAILYRNNRSSVDIEEALMKKNIPYKVVGGLSFLDRKEVKVMLAHAKCLLTLEDINALTMATSFPKIGVGKKRLDMWRNIALEKNTPIEKVIEIVADPQSSDVKADVKAAEFLNKIKEGRESIIKMGLRNGLENYLKSIKYNDAFADKKNYLDIIKAIDAVLSSLEQYEDDGGKSLDDFINNLLMLDSMADNDSEAVWLSSIHSSKGLEFEHVYLCGWEDGTLPNKRVLSEDENLVDEERRLAYVAVTRAKKSLVITFKQAIVHYSEEDKDQILYVETLKPSRYFSDIDPKYFTLPLGTLWPPSPLPINWGKYEKYPTGDQIKIHRLDGSKLRYTEDGHLLTPRSPDFSISPEKQEIENKTGYNINDYIEHKRFGVGRIISMANQDDINNARLTVDFERGSQEFILKYTKIKKVVRENIQKES